MSKLAGSLGIGSLGIVALVGFAGFALRGQQESAEEQISRFRNLGKAFYENPTTQAQAVAQFKSALDLAPNSARERINYGLALLKAGKTEDGTKELLAAQKQDPTLPHTWFNLGIVYKKDSDYEKAIAQFEQMIKLVPDEPISHYNLGVLYRLSSKPQEALREFEAAARLNPNLAGPHFQLFNAYRQAARTEDSAREEKAFQDIKRRQAGAAIPEDLEWSFYSEIFDVIDPAAEANYPAPQILKFKATQLGTGMKNGGLAVADVDDDGKLDLIAWSDAGIRFFRAGAAKAEDLGLAAVKDVVSVTPGDFDNDGLMDLAVVTKEGVDLYRNKKTAFEKQPGTMPRGAFAKVVWVDYDHDYDVDLFAFGEKSALFRNSGTSGFTDESASFPFAAGKPTDAVFLDIVPDTDGMDIAVAYADHAGVIYRDKLAGRYAAENTAAIPAGATAIHAVDYNNDGITDLAALTGAGVVLIANHEKSFEAASPLAAKNTALLADLDNRGLFDVLTEGNIHRNGGRQAFKATAVSELAEATALAAADFDNDGRVDLASINANGDVQLLTNQGDAAAKWLRVKLTGVKNLKTGYGSEVEIKAGAYYQKQTYRGVPLYFGLGSRPQVETVRISWPNGMIQNQVRENTGRALEYKEAPRLSGSCPMIFTWNGQDYTFITDVLGVAPLGASSGDGTYFPVDHDEYIQIPGESLVARNGKYEVRITEELKEISYLDQIQLIAVDHPASVDIYTNDKFKSPPFPEFRLFGVEKRVYPEAARDDKKQNVLAKLLHQDRAYADTFPRDFEGRAGMHSLDLDFGKAAKDGRAVLILNGWVDWADGSTFRAASQEKGHELVMPYLQVKDAKGQWKTVVEEMGIPSGKPKTISVDLTGKFLSASREVRIVTNLCVYWDEIFLSENSSAPEVISTQMMPQTADLHFRGFSKPVIDRERKQPEAFIYSKVSLDAPWNPTPGYYTRFGEVANLLESPDDRMVIMGSGDEVTLQFDAAKLPALRAGWKRDFLLLVDGWAKDSDANTAFSRTVEPLPFHGMTAYPYPTSEKYPEDEEHRKYTEKYNTRPALNLLRSLSYRTEESWLHQQAESQQTKFARK
ncbi:MAG: FG-GAP-like repeat-containing protein [Bryobacteraceae bacterium]